jgi:hypothetical protein
MRHLQWVQRRWGISPILGVGQILKGFSYFREISKGLAPYTPMELLRDDEDNLKQCDFEKAKIEWPIGSKTNKDMKMNPSYRLANILAQVVILLDPETPPWSREIQDTEPKCFSDTNKGLNIQLFGVNTTTPANLGPFPDLGESKLEGYNRLHCILRYLQYVVTSKAHWTTPFGSPGFNKSGKISVNNIPDWMQALGRDWRGATVVQTNYAF